ncbi:hypothetical protein C5C17_00955 [Pseudoclavibacter sp. RFBA6]|nr:hypothetical protein C5C17_00955 [Pseudoclavibacter sp. RFBA6]
MSDMSSRSSAFLTRLANIASLALAALLALSVPGTLTQTPLWLNLLLATVTVSAAASFALPSSTRAPALRDSLLLLLCLLQHGLWLALAPHEFALVLPWSWAVWLSGCVIVTVRHGRWPGVAFASVGILSYPASLALLGEDLAASSPAVLIAPLFLAPVPLLVEQGKRKLDAFRAAALSGARASASASHASARMRSQLQTKQDFAAFVHDNVLGALVAAAHSNGQVSDKLRELCRTALSGLSAPALTDDDGPPISLREFSETIAAIAERSHARWMASLPRTAMPVVPTRIAHDFEHAFRQAAENSVAHAGSGAAGRASRFATFTATDRSLELRYRDDGAGFVLADVPGHRLGLRGSILHRIEQHPGATALVDSAPGAGTTVTLRWDPAADRREGTAVESLASRASGGGGALVAYWSISAATSFLTVGMQTHPSWTLVANAIVGAAMMCLAFGMRLTPVLVWSIACLPLLTSLLVLPQATPSMPRWQFTLEMATLLCAYLIVQGRLVPGLLGFASMAVVGLGWAWSYGGFHMLQSTRWLATILIGVAVVCWWHLRRESQALSALRQHEQAALQQMDDALIALDGVDQQRQWIDSVARQTLEDIVRYPTLDSQHRDRARRVEARVRDRMRSPALSVGALECAADAARSRGVTVSVLDDAASAGGLPSSVLEEVITHLSAAESGNIVTVRRTAAPIDDASETPALEHRVSVFIGSADAPGTLRYVVGTEVPRPAVIPTSKVEHTARMSMAPPTV